MTLEETKLTKVLRELNVKAKYEYEGKYFYDTSAVFDRHNFARDLRRVLKEEEKCTTCLNRALSHSHL